MYWTKAFWKGLGERAIKTFAQTFSATLTVMIAGGLTGITQINFVEVISISALATLLSAVTSVGNAQFTAGEPTATLEG